MMLNRAHSPVIAVAFVLVAMALAGCFGTNQEDHSEQAVEDCRVDHCIEEAVEDCRVDHCIEEAVEDCRVDHCIEVTIDAIECPEEYDNMRGDNVCLAYNGQIPGPTWVFHEGESVKLTLMHNVEETIKGLDVEEALAERLSGARYSLHRHGVAMGACDDGVAQPEQTQVCDSTVEPGEAITYKFEARFPGYWHYHDHAHSFSEDPANPPILGHEGKIRGLWGSFLTLEGGFSTDCALDLHLIDQVGEQGRQAGANGGIGLEETFVAHERFDIIVTGLGLWFWEFTLFDPDGTLVGEVLVGPGASRGIAIETPKTGDYVWQAEGFQPRDNDPVEHFEGTITVLEGDGENEANPPCPGSDRYSDDMGDRTADDANFQATGSRVFALQFNLWCNDPLREVCTPFLEAYAGEELHFAIFSNFNPAAEDLPFPPGNQFDGHTFHLHGHPWEDSDTDTMIDTALFPPTGASEHRFTVIAGLGEGHAGDWLYHCHVDDHAASGMWSILRVYPHSMQVQGTPTDLLVTVKDTTGAPVQQADIQVRWNPHAPPDPTLESVNHEIPLRVEVNEVYAGTYNVQPELPHGATGELVIESRHETGNSLARLTLLPDGGWVENRHVGLKPTGPFAGLETRLLEDRPL